MFEGLYTALVTPFRDRDGKLDEAALRDLVEWQIESGVDGLVHISKLGDGKRIAHPGEAVAEGDTLDVTVERIETDTHRISLAPAVSAQQKQDSAEEEALLNEFIRSHQDAGKGD